MYERDQLRVPRGELLHNSPIIGFDTSRDEFLGQFNSSGTPDNRIR